MTHYLQHLSAHLPETADALHHAYSIEGEVNELIAALRDILTERFAIPVEGNPDVMMRTYDEGFGIDDARALRASYGTRSVRATRRIVMLAARTMTHEAQNALLKLCEEPSGDTVFFIIIPSRAMILPTLSSRVVTIPAPHGSHEGALMDADAFLQATRAGRVALAETYAKDETLDAMHLVPFLNTLEERLYAHRTENTVALHAIARCRTYAHARGASVKGILEYLAFVML